MKDVLVTGATGYVGRELVRQLLEMGIAVTGLGRTQSKGNIPFIQADLSDAEALDRALDGSSFDCIMHLASLPGDTGNPLQMVELNINGLQNLLEYARRVEVNRFVQASSVSAYEWYPGTKFNPPDYMPVDENHPCRPKDIYSTTKRMQEELALTYYHQYEVPTTVLRLTAVVGPHGQGGGRGWREIAAQLAEGVKVQIPHFSTEELCHYVDYRDVARMHIAAGEHPGAVGEIFNCCGASPTRGSEFVEIIKGILPDIEVECGFPWSMAQGEEVSFDMSKAKTLIGFEPAYTLADSIRSIKDWVDAGGLTAEASTGDGAFSAGVEQSER